MVWQVRHDFITLDFLSAIHSRDIMWGRNEETTYHTGLYVCRQPRRPWADMWAEMQWFQ
jgi:hypothetical protein